MHKIGLLGGSFNPAHAGFFPLLFCHCPACQGNDNDMAGASAYFAGGAEAMKAGGSPAITF